MDLITLAMAKKYSDRKGGYTETSAPVVVIPKDNYEFDNGEYVTPITQFPKEGDFITLTFDGAVHTETAKRGAVDDLEILYIGNDALLGGHDTSKNYFVAFVLNQGVVIVSDVVSAGSGSIVTHTVELSFAGQTIHHIAPQYMPCVTLETIVSTAETIMSDADAAKLDALAAVGMPAVIKFKYEFPASGDAASWCSYMKSEGVTVFKCRLGAYETEISFTFVGAGGEWKCLYVVG